jgi:hypothetical protein
MVHRGADRVRLAWSDRRAMAIVLLARRDACDVARRARFRGTTLLSFGERDRQPPW